MIQFSNDEISRLVSNIPKGKENAINAPDLAIMLGYSPEPNQEELRALIRQAINQGELIGSSHSGYWIINSITEVEGVLDSLEQRAQGVCDRRNNLLDSWNTNNHRNKSLYLHVNVKP